MNYDPKKRNLLVSSDNALRQQNTEKHKLFMDRSHIDPNRCIDPSPNKYTDTTCFVDPNLNNKVVSKKYTDKKKYNDPCSPTYADRNIPDDLKHRNDISHSYLPLAENQNCGSREKNYNRGVDKDKNQSAHNPMDNDFTERLERLTARVGGDQLEPEMKNLYLEKLKRDLSLATNSHSQNNNIDSKTFSSLSRQPYLLEKNAEQQRQQINSQYISNQPQPTNRSTTNLHERFDDIKNVRQNSVYSHDVPNFRSDKDAKLGNVPDKAPYETNNYNELHQTSSENGKHAPSQSVPPTRSYNETRPREYQQQRPYLDTLKQYEEQHDGYASENYVYQNQPQYISQGGPRDKMPHDDLLAEKVNYSSYCDQTKGVEESKHLENSPQKYRYPQWEKRYEPRSGLQDISKQKHQNTRRYSNHDDKEYIMRRASNSGISDKSDKPCKEINLHSDYYPSFDPYLVRPDGYLPQSDKREYTHKDREYSPTRQPYYMGDMPDKLESQGTTYSAANPHYEYKNQTYENTTDRSKVSNNHPSQKLERHNSYNEPQQQYQQNKESEKNPVLRISATMPNTYQVPSQQMKRNVDKNNYNVPYGVDNSFPKRYENSSAARLQQQNPEYFYNRNKPRFTVQPFYKRNGLQDHRQSACGTLKNKASTRVANCDGSYAPSNGLTAPQTFPQEWEQYPKH